MKVSASLWSVDPLAVGTAMEQVEQVVHGFHIDVMDGHFVPELLFGPDFVRAVHRHTRRLVDVHLMVDDADRWIAPFAAAGAGMITVHPQSCPAIAATLTRLHALGLQAGVAVTVDMPLEPIYALLDQVDRVLLMGTQLGIKGAEIEPAIYERIRALVQGREGSTRHADIFVDGGIRRHTVPLIAQSGADGVTPGSLVFGADDPVAVVQWIEGHHGQGE